MATPRASTIIMQLCTCRAYDSLLAVVLLKALRILPARV